MFCSNDFEIPDWFDIDNSNTPTIECGEKLISLEDTNCNSIIYEPVYYQNNISGAIDNCLLREGVFKRLVTAANMLPDGYKLKIFDAWRPYSVQYALYCKQKENLIMANPHLKHNEKELKKLLTEFVSYPQKDSVHPYVHSTGGAVDLTIINENGLELNMGTSFDDFSKNAHTDSFKNSTNKIVKNNRNLLYSIMINAGFTNFPSEWWHFDYGDSFWAKINNTTAIYGGIYEIKER